jgi:hypothetical protein
VKEVLRAKPLYMVIESRYREEVEMPELDHQKQKLRDLRNFYKPVTDLKIDKHQRNYEMHKRQMDSDIRKQRNLSMKNIREHVASLKYKPHLTDYKDELQQHTLEEQERLKEEKKRAQEKVGNYAKYVKEMYWPKVSEKKRQELEILNHPQTIKKNRASPNRRANSASKAHNVSFNDSYGYSGGHNLEGLSNVQSVPHLGSI